MLRQGLQPRLVPVWRSSYWRCCSTAFFARVPAPVRKSSERGGSVLLTPRISLSPDGFHGPSRRCPDRGVLTSGADLRQPGMCAQDVRMTPSVALSFSDRMHAKWRALVNETCNRRLVSM